MLYVTNKQGRVRLKQFPPSRLPDYSVTIFYEELHTDILQLDSLMPVSQHQHVQDGVDVSLVTQNLFT